MVASSATHSAAGLMPVLSAVVPGVVGVGA